MKIYKQFVYHYKKLKLFLENSSKFKKIKECADCSKLFEFFVDLGILVFTYYFTLSKESNFFQSIEKTDYKAHFILAYFDPLIKWSLLILLVIYIFTKFCFFKLKKRKLLIAVIIIFIIVVIVIINLFFQKPLDTKSLLSADFNNKSGINIFGVNASGTLVLSTAVDLGNLQSSPQSGTFMFYNTVLSSGLPANTMVGGISGVGDTNVLSVVGLADGNGYQGVSSGRVGIGSSTPQALLSLQGYSGQTADLISVASSSNAVLFTINKDGKVGIGTTTPVTTLDINGSIRIQSKNFEDCNKNIEGSILYNINDKHFYGCNGIKWNLLDK